MDTTTYQHQWELDNKERRKIYKQKHYQKNKDRYRKNQQNWRLDNRDRQMATDRRGHLRRAYNLTIEDYNEMIKEQKGLCKLCKQPLDLTINNCIDHDHKCCEGEKACGKCIRGVLHDECNRYIALLERKPKLLIHALAYIEFDLKAHAPVNPIASTQA